MKPLEHLRVLELGQVIAGTVPGMLMADLGADVIKVEPPQGDLGRNPHVGYMRGESALFLTFNRGKRSIAIDLKRDLGRDAFYDLVRNSDVVVDNFRPGVVERMRIDHATLSALNPRIITCSISGFAPNSKRRDMPSFDLTHQALSGLMSVTGEPNGPPVRFGIPMADIGAALFAVQGILAAVVERERTGRGRKVELNMLECMTFLNTYDATIYLNTGEVPRRWGSGHAYQIPWQAFETSDGHVVVATREEIFWRAYCQAIGLPELAADPRYATNLDRLRHRDALTRVLEARMRERSTAGWLSVFEQHQVPSAPVNDVAQAFNDPGMPAEGVVVDVPYEPLGTVRMQRNPVHFAGEDAGRYSAPPRLAEHTSEVLAAVAGYSETQISALRKDGTIAVAPDGEGLRR